MFTTRFSGVLVVSVILTGSTLGGSDAVQRSSSSVEPVKISTQLLEMKEFRTLSFKKEDENAFVFAQDQPGLFLTFKAQLPKGYRLISVEQPESVVATDSAGHDLGDIEANIIGEQTWIEVQTIYGFQMEDQEQEIEFRLSLPARDSSTFSLAATSLATIYQGTEEYTSPLTMGWTTLDPNIFDGMSVKARLQESTDGSWGVELVPGAAAEFINDVYLRFEGDELERSGSLSDGRSIIYYFEDDIDPDEPLTIALMVRTGVEQIKLTFDVKDQDLP